MSDDEGAAGSEDERHEDAFDAQTFFALIRDYLTADNSTQATRSFNRAKSIARRFPRDVLDPRTRDDVGNHLTLFESLSREHPHSNYFWLFCSIIAETQQVIYYPIVGSYSVGYNITARFLDGFNEALDAVHALPQDEALRFCIRIARPFETLSNAHSFSCNESRSARFLLTGITSEFTLLHQFLFQVGLRNDASKLYPRRAQFTCMRRVLQALLYKATMPPMKFNPDILIMTGGRIYTYLSFAAFYSAPVSLVKELHGAMGDSRWNSFVVLEFDDGVLIRKDLRQEIIKQRITIVQNSCSDTSNFADDAAVDETFQDLIDEVQDPQNRYSGTAEGDTIIAALETFVAEVRMTIHAFRDTSQSQFLLQMRSKIFTEAFRTFARIVIDRRDSDHNDVWGTVVQWLRTWRLHDNVYEICLMSEYDAALDISHDVDEALLSLNPESVPAVAAIFHRNSGFADAVGQEARRRQLQRHILADRANAELARRQQPLVDYRRARARTLEEENAAVAHFDQMWGEPANWRELVAAEISEEEDEKGKSTAAASAATLWVEEVLTPPSGSLSKSSRAKRPQE